MNLDELIKNTDALTYANALKVTISEIKDKASQVEELSEYIANAVQDIRKLTRKADAQYRLLAKLAQNDTGSLANSISIEEDEVDEETKNLMEQIDDE